MKSRGDRNSDSPTLHENDICEKKHDQTSRQPKSNPKDGEDVVSIVPDLSHLSPEQQRIILSQTELGHDQSSPSYLDLYSFATFPERCLNVLGLFAAAGAGVCQPLMIFVFGDLITDFVNYTTALNTGNAIAGARADLTNGVKDGALYLVYIAIAMFCCTYTYMGIWTYNGEKTTRRIREQYFKAVMRQNIGWWETVGAGEITTRLTSDMATLQRGISEKVPILTQSLSCFCVAFVVAFIKDWRLAFALSAMLPVMILAGSLYFAFDSKAKAAAMSKISEGSNLAEEVFAAVRTVQAYGSQNKLADLYNVSNKRAQLEANKGVLAGAICMSIYYFSFYAGYALAIFFGTILVYQGKASVGDVIACMEAVVIGALSISLIGPQTQAINGAKGASAKVLPTIWRVPPIDSASPEGKRLSVIEGELRFDRVDLYYPSRPTLKVLDNFSAVFPKGKVTALVGTSGSGKSSVIGLLERFYSPLAGTIYLDGQDIATMNVKWLRGQIGLVSQEPTLFAGSIHDNVAHGLTGTPFENEELEKKRERVIKACKVANADDFVRQLSEGYDTLVGERGLLLSGGQAQRIAIARAIIAEPPILVLDEATSALDVTSERLVQRALNQASIGRTTIAIAHRLSTIIDANQIIVMSNGQIVEQGTHASLLEDKNGVYSGLVALQSLREEKASTTAAAGIDPEEEPLETMPALARAATAYTTLAAHTPTSQEESGKRMGIFKVAQRVVRENEGLRWIYIIAVGGTMISGTAFPAVSILFGSLLSTFSDRPADHWQSRNNLLAGFMFLVACVTMLAILAQFYSFLYAAESVSMKLRSKLFKATVRQDISFFDETKNSTGALTSAIAHKPQQICSAAGMTTAAILQSVITLSVGLIIAFVYAWKVALVALACVPLIMAAGYTRLKVIELKDSKTEAIHESVAQMACEAAGAIKTVASLRREDAFSEIYSEALEKPMQLAYKTAILGNLFYSCGQALQFPILALVFWFGQTRMINDGLSTGDFFVALFGAIFSAIEAATIFSYVPDISGAKQGAVSAFRLLDSKPKTDLFANEGKEAGQEGHVVFKDVHFRYPTRPNVPVLRGLDLEIKPGQFVALVGPSGCGKSTTIQLMERFYDPIRGTIELDGSDIRSINLKSLRSQLALVSQTPTLFDGTVAFNITLGALDNVTQEDIEAAARLANIHDFIASLPDGYETQVGGKGGKLSGGQKQRIAIARALIRQPKVLLLDEATSALDSQSEKVVQSALDAAAKSRTTICIAHRLSTIQNADVICVFKEGRIAEKGSHDELLRRRGLYYELVQEQSLAT